MLDADSWWTNDEKFDVVSCLNLLDRCSDPEKLLTDMKQAVKPDGRIVVALVLPYRPFDEFSESIKLISSTEELIFSTRDQGRD